MLRLSYNVFPKKPIRFCAMCLSVSLVICWLIALSPISTEEWKCLKKKNDPHTAPKHTVLQSGRHRLAVLVPYRDRFEELLQFAPHMHNFLSVQGVDHHIYILNQVDDYRFNRASLINVGFLISRSDCDYIAMHDVDLLPINPELSYHYPKVPGPFHIASPELHPRYHYATFVGGILLVRREEFEKVNGMSNKYWGWGLEDDEFYVRLTEAGLTVSRPVNVSTGTHNTFRHIHDRVKRKRDMAKCYNQREITRRRDRETGLHDVSYEIDSERKVTIDDAPLTIVNIRLKCDRNMTPWCSCVESETVSSRNAKDREPLKKISVDHVEKVIVPNVKQSLRPKGLSDGKKSSQPDHTKRKAK